MGKRRKGQGNGFRPVGNARGLPDAAATKPPRPGANNPSEHKDTRSANENESHQRRNAGASLPPRSGVPCTIHRAESIPLPFPPLTHFPLAISFIHS